MKLMHQSASSRKPYDGERSFLTYYDIGFAEASSGKVGGMLVEAAEEFPGPTGWHAYDCEYVLVYVVRGWVKLQYGDGRVVHLQREDTLLVPGGTPQNALDASSELKLFEVTVPAGASTYPCDPPAWLQNGNHGNGGPGQGDVA